ncbi:MAG: hypothetical protein E2P02_11435 [Acidobacteria bacterium]|nr:MAG: hypothetical protein E2P02_11435 [Acidobacteriota bacterium]
MTTARLKTLLLLTTCLHAVPYAWADEKDKSKLLTRSIYVPLELELCEHLHDAVLYQNEQVVSTLPSKRIFQFTYYPNLGRMEPVRTDVRVVGFRENGEEFVGRLAITPWGIFTANTKVELDLKAQLRRFRHKIDVRYRLRSLTLRCSDTCGREPALVAADARVPASP